MSIQNNRIHEMKQPQPQTVTLRDSFKQIAKAIYYIHLFVIFVYTIILFILQPKLLIQFTFSLALIIIYGFLIVWTILFILICVLLKNNKLAQKCSRWGVKITTVLFILLCPIAQLSDHFLLRRSVITFMIYQFLFSTLMVIYMIYDCTCGHHSHMEEIYRPNQLSLHEQQIKEAKIQRESIKKKLSEK